MQSDKNINIPQQILFINDLEALIGRSRLTLRRWWEDGKFPPPVKLHGKTLAWQTQTVMDWIEKNMNAGH